MPKGRTAVLWLSLAVAGAAVLLYYSVRGIDWAEVRRIVAGANPARLLLAAGVSSLTLFLRAVRWRVLLNAEGDVPVSTAFWATTAGYFGNNFLPARGGEFVRTAMISSRSGLDLAYVLATAASERAADAIALVIIAGLTIGLLPSRPEWMGRAAMFFAAVGGVGAVTIAVLPRLDRWLAAVLQRVTRAGAFRAKLEAALHQALRGLRAFHSVRRLTQFTGFTAIIWTFDAIGTTIGASALGLAIPLRAAYLLMAALGLGSALPSTPGYVGIFQFVAVSVLPPFGLSRTDAIAYILVAQAVNYVVVGAWGAIGLTRYRA